MRVRIGGFTGGPKAALEARLSDLRIRAGALPDMPAAEQVAGKGAALVIVLVAFLAMSLTFGVVWLAVRSRRMRTRAATQSGPARRPTVRDPAR